jgi:HEAT repeat protein
VPSGYRISNTGKQVGFCSLEDLFQPLQRQTDMVLPESGHGWEPCPGKEKGMSPADSDRGERTIEPVRKAEDGTLHEAKRSLLLQQLEAQPEPGVIPDLVKFLASDQDEEVRVLAASALGRTRHADAVPHLAQVLADAREDLMLRRAAAWGLHRIQDADAVTHLGQVLIDKDEVYEIRWTAAEALKEMGRIDAIRYLGKALADQAPQIQKVAAQALLDLDHPHAAPYFRSALKEVGNPEVRRIAAMALGRARDMDAIPLLGRVLTEDDNRIVRQTAAKALGQIGEVGASPSLSKALKEHQDVLTRLAAADVLGIVHHTDAVQLLC